MDPFRGVTIQIVVNGQSLPFYDNPDAVEDASHHTCQKYIEAVTGSAFQVKFLLTSDFELYSLEPKDAVRMSIDIGQGRSWRFDISRSKIERSWAQGSPAEHTFTGIRHLCKESGQWVRSNYTFTDLESNESSPAQLSVTEALELGRIRLTIHRVEREERLVPKFRSTVPMATVTEVPEKALKGRSIANTVSLAKGMPSRAPEPSRHRGVAIAGPGGRRIVFDIFYRARRSLQMMGCITRSPSPAKAIPENKSNDQSTASSFTSAGGSQDVLREVQDLRARLAQLERGLNAEAESSDANTRIKAEQVRAIKREREEDENGRPRQRRRMPAEIEHVDLTDD